MNLEDLFTEAIKRNEEKNTVFRAELMTELIKSKTADEAMKFQDTVLNYLYKHEPSVEKICRLHGMEVDSALWLKNKSLLLCEFKYSLGWYTSSVARVEVLSFIGQKFYEQLPEPMNKYPDRALIVFKDFSRDWIKNGWCEFYFEEEGIRSSFPAIPPTDIAQLLKNGELFNPYARS
jgi:hypothetical protein